jgi:hypothetical protein
MTALVAAIRADELNLPLLVHVFGALVLVGTLATTLMFQLAGWRRSGADTAAFGRLAWRTLLLGALPAWFVMRIGAQWVYSEGGYESDDEPAWLGIGWITADAGGLALLLSIVLAGLGARRLRAAEGRGTGLARAATVLAALALLAYLVAVWAMSAKPS